MEQVIKQKREPMQPSYEYMQTEQYTENKKSKGWLWFILVLIVVGAGIGIYFWLF